MRLSALLLLLLATAPAAAESLVLRPEICAALVAAPEGGAEYVPGRDASGRAVAPADLPAVPGPRFDEIAIKLTADLRRRFGLPADRRFAGEAELGYVTIIGNKAHIDGAPLAPGSEAALAALCRRGPWRDPPR